MDAEVVRRLGKQRTRAVASVMDVVDSDRLGLTARQRGAVRKAVLDGVNEMHRTDLLIVEAAEQGLTVNELLAELVIRKSG